MMAVKKAKSDNARKRKGIHGNCGHYGLYASATQKSKTAFAPLEPKLARG